MMTGGVGLIGFATAGRRILRDDLVGSRLLECARTSKGGQYEQSLSICVIIVSTLSRLAELCSNKER